MHVFFIQTKPSADLCADGAAELQCRALASGGTAAKVGDDGAGKNQGREQDRHAALAAHGVDHNIGAGVFQVRQLIYERN